MTSNKFSIWKHLFRNHQFLVWKLQDANANITLNLRFFHQTYSSLIIAQYSNFLLKSQEIFDVDFCPAPNSIIIYFMWSPEKNKILTPNYHTGGFFRCNFMTTELDEGESPSHPYKSQPLVSFWRIQPFSHMGNRLLQIERKGGATVTS